MRIFAHRHAIKQTDTNSKTEAHSYPLWIVGERANNWYLISIYIRSSVRIKSRNCPLLDYPQTTVD